MSQELQSLISRLHPSTLERLVEELIPSISSLMTDIYGNYACQALFSSVSSQQKLELLQRVAPFLTPSAHFVDVLPRRRKLLPTELFRQHPLLSDSQIRDLHYQSLLVALREKKFIIDDWKIIWWSSVWPLGLCVIKKCLTSFEVYKRVLSHGLVLIQDPYGNYVISKVIELWGEACYRPLTE